MREELASLAGTRNAPSLVLGVQGAKPPGEWFLVHSAASNFTEVASGASVDFPGWEFPRPRPKAHGWRALVHFWTSRGKICDFAKATSSLVVFKSRSEGPGEDTRCIYTRSDP